MAMWIIRLLILSIVSLHQSHCLDRLPCLKSSASEFAQKTKSASFMLEKAAFGDESGMCLLSTTCCSAEAEKALESYSRIKLSADIVATHTYMRRSFSHFETTFQELYNHILDTSKANALRIFNLVYKEHFSDDSIFDDLYASAKRFYGAPGENEVEKALQNLFDQLLVEIFKGSHNAPGVTLSKQYRDCLMTTTKEMDVFGEEDDNTVWQLKRALNSTAVFLVAVRTARKVLDSFLDLVPSDDCIREYMKMHPCSLCGGFPDGKPCRGLCMNVLQMCLGDVSGLDTAFNTYLKAALDMLTQMENTSPDTLIGDLGSQFSSLVMEIYNQIKENSAHGNKIIQLCGPLANSRGRRSANLLVVDQVTPAPTPKSHPSDMDLSIQLAFAKEIMTFFQSSINDTASEICLRESARTGSSCWNGTDLARYSGSHINGLRKVDNHRQTVLDKLIKPLQKVTGMMRKWNSVSDWNVVVPNSRGTIGKLDQPTDAVNSETLCPEDDECENGSGRSNGSGSGEGLPDGDEEDVKKPTDESTETTIPGGAQSYQFVLTAIMTVVMVTSVVVL